MQCYNEFIWNQSAITVNIGQIPETLYNVIALKHK